MWSLQHWKVKRLGTLRSSKWPMFVSWILNAWMKLLSLFYLVTDSRRETHSLLLLLLCCPHWLLYPHVSVVSPLSVAVTKYLRTSSSVEEKNTLVQGFRSFSPYSPGPVTFGPRQHSPSWQAGMEVEVVSSPHGDWEVKGRESGRGLLPVSPARAHL